MKIEETLKDISQSTKLVELVSVTPSSEEIITYCARVSNPKNQANMSTAPKLLKYLIDHQHWSPFELASMTLQIKTSRGISPQILRHRSFTFQEFCLSGDSKIAIIKPNGCTTTETIADLYNIQQSSLFKGKMLRVFDESTKTFTSAALKQVFKTGVKPVFKVDLEDGKSIVTTKEHKFLTKNGFLSLEEIIGLDIQRCSMSKVGIIAVNGEECRKSCHDKINWQELGTKKRPTLIPKWKKITSVTYMGEVETYDLEVNHPSHNYVANKIVVHNSQRYAAVDETGLVLYAARRQDDKNRQNSIDDLPEVIRHEWEQRQLQNWKSSFEHYTWALNNGIAKECARFVLPLGTATTMYMAGTVRSWIHYIGLRTANGTQAEHKEIAESAKKVFKEQFPTIAEALGW